MINALRIDSSLFSEKGVSAQLADALTAELTRKYGEINLIKRNLAEEGIPHFDGAWLEALSTPVDQRTAEQQIKVNYSDTLITETQNADVLVIGAPMYNFGVPSVLKAWFDHIARAGVTFQYTSQGPQGLLTEKTAYIITTRGGLHRDKPSDTQAPFVKNFLNFLGISDVEIIYAEGLNMSHDAREQGIKSAHERILNLVAA